MTVQALITALGDHQVQITHASPGAANALGISAVLTQGADAGAEAMAEEVLRYGMSARMVVWDGLELRIREIPASELLEVPA